MIRSSDDPIRVLSIIYHHFALWRAPDWLKERLERDFPQLNVTVRHDYKDIEREIADVEIFVGYSLRPGQLRHARKLRWIHSTAAAVHQLMSPELIESDIVVTNARSVHGPVVAEHAIALVLALAKRLPACAQFQQQQHWAQNEVWAAEPSEISGAVLAVIGIGSIGREVARLAKALGMRVLAVREHPERGADTADEVFSPASLNAVLARADFVVLAAPVTARTEHLIGPKQLKHMKHDAFLINVARGDLIDDDALIAALDERRIAGAALDVFDHEPLPRDSRYWRLPNVLITPHTAGLTSKMWNRQYVLLSENMRRYFAGEPLLNLVDKRSGY